MLAGILTLALAVLVLLGDTAIPERPMAAFAYLAVMLLASSLVAMILIGQSRATSLPFYRLLGAGYLFLAVMALPCLMSTRSRLHPGLLPMATDSTYLYSGGLAVAGLFVGVIAAGLAYERSGQFQLTPRGHPAGPGPSPEADRRAKSTAMLVTVLALLLTAILALGSDEFPDIVLRAAGVLSYAEAVQPAGWFLVLLGLAACLTLVPGAIRGSKTHNWLLAAMIVNVVAILIETTGAGPYDKYWYVARALGLLSALTLLVVLVRFQINSNLQQAELHRDLIEQRERADAATAETARMAATDPLTGLRNRASFASDLDYKPVGLGSHELASGSAERTGTTHESVERRAATSGSSHRAALVMLDLDGFKLVNDTYGHAAGDQVLVEVARRLAVNVRSTDRVYRLGGDEFALWMPTTAAGTKDIEGRLRVLVNAVRQPIRVDRHLITIGLSVGVAFSPDHDLNSTGNFEHEALLRRADMAMYAAKHRHSNRALLFEGSIERVASARGQMGQDLRAALGTPVFSYQFQPIVDLRSGEPWGVEALMRWKTGDRVRPAADFISVADVLGYLPEMSLVCLSDLAGDLDMVFDSLGRGATVCLNFSLGEMSDPDIVYALLHGPLARHAQRFALELSAQHPGPIDAGLVTVLAGLREAGYRVSVDDPGIGRAGYANLRRISPSVFKVDRAFVAASGGDGGALGYVEAIATLARAFRADTIAVGIESAARADQMLAAGITLGQGVHIAPPMEISELGAWSVARK